MSLEEKINADIKASMLAKDKRKLEALRAVKSALLLLKTNGTGKEITEEDEITLLQRLVKQRKESASLYKEQGREDLYEEEFYQQGIIEAYLPEQLSEEEVTETLKQIIADTQATSMKDMGKEWDKLKKYLQEEPITNLYLP
jgi:uncharacterized protein YqeY